MADRNDFNAQIIREFRENGGKVGGPFEGSPMIILHTVGAKSGEEHVTPLVYFSYKERRYIIASAAGAPKNPAWYHNLKANPDVRIEIGDGNEDVTASEINGAGHAEVWSALVQAMPGFGDYQRNTTRTIPLMALDPRS